MGGGLWITIYKTCFPNTEREKINKKGGKERREGGVIIFRHPWPYLVVGEKLLSNPARDVLEVGELLEDSSPGYRGCLNIGLGPPDTRQGVE